MRKDNTIEVFFALVRAGLWETDVQLTSYGEVDYESILRIAREQSVVGLVAAGLEHVTDAKIPQVLALQFAGETIQLEQRNKAMNQFIADLVAKMRNADINPLLVKGQGIAECYERPLWRSCGDIDFLLCESNYENAKQLLLPLASSVELEGKQGKHLGMTIDSWVVELHGGLRCGLSTKMDQEIEEILKGIFCSRDVRSWMNRQTQIILPGENSDVFIVFTHFIKHFYKEGLGLRQICDWCRLLWTYRESINGDMLKTKLEKMELKTEWQVFGTFAVEYLGMPAEAMPLYELDKKRNRKANRICDYIMKVGNFGKKRDVSYFAKYPYFVRKIISLDRRFGVILNHARIFPLDSIRFFPNIVLYGLRNAVRGE